jgi:tetratricopeptide (TPR) repeat protein
MFAASPRLRSCDVFLAANPGFEPAVLQEATRLDQEGRRDQAQARLARCADENPRACTCLSSAIPAALDAHRFSEVVGWTDRAAACISARRLWGARAEALAGAGRVEDATRSANLALQAFAGDPHAAYALAIGRRARGDARGAEQAAEQAIASGRGNEARLFLGTLRMSTGDLAGARAAFEAALSSDPRSAPAAYDIALLDQRANHYRRAREGYLHALELDPELVDARYNLVVLTMGVGARDEARHHLSELVRAAPDDPRIPGLESALSSGGAPPP